MSSKSRPRGRRRRRAGPLLAIAIPVVTLLAALAMWPQSLGGDFAYVLISGNSMEPAISSDDLVLIRRAPSYEAGDAVAYRHPDIGTVLHRIVARDGDRFVLRGDNRTTNDSYHPKHEEIVGREWIVAPGVGGMLRSGRSPAGATALLGGAVMLGGIATTRPGGRSRRDPPSPPPPSPPRGGGPSLYTDGGVQLSIALGALLLGGALLFVLPLMQGSERLASEPVSFAEEGSFSYGGDLPGDVYDAGRLGAPQPLFRAVADELPIRYSYRLSSLSPGEELTEVLGRHDLVAEVRQHTGWSHTIQLQPTLLFTGTEFEAQGRLELAQVQRVIDALEETTGVKADVYRVRVTSRVSADVAFSGERVVRERTQSIEFLLTELQMQFDPTSSTIEMTDVASVARPVVLDRELHLPVGGIAIPYRRLPLLGGATVAAALAGLTLLLAKSAAVGRSGQAARIKARYGALLVNVGDEDAARLDASDRLLDVVGIEQLAQLAEREGQLLLHHTNTERDAYYALASGAVYRCEIHRPRSGRPRGWTAQDGWLWEDAA